MTTDTIHVGQLRINYIVDGSKNGQMGMFEMTLPPGTNVPPPHSHSDNEELVYVLEGKLRYWVDAESRDLEQGQTMSTPKGSVHAFANPFDAPAKVLITLSPDVGAQYFKDVSAVLPAQGPPDKAAVAAVMARYGLVPAAPK
jgi:quercetin dioxygenase-like cupin family protein